MAASAVTPIRSLPLRNQMGYPLSLDFVTPMSYQRRLEGDAPVYYLEGSVSESIDSVASGATEEVPTEFGKLRRSNENRDVTEIELGSEDPFDESQRSFSVAPLAEMWEDLLDRFPVADMVIHRRGTRREVPDPVASTGSLDGAEEVAHLQRAHGNRTTKLQRQIGVRLQSPYHIVKALLLEHGDLDPSDIGEFSKRAKSTLATDYMLADNGYNHQRFRQDGLFQDLSQQLRAGRYWKDLAVPQDLEMHANGTQLDGRIYRLKYNDGLLGI